MDFDWERGDFKIAFWRLLEYDTIVSLLNTYSTVIRLPDSLS